MSSGDFALKLCLCKGRVEYVSAQMLSSDKLACVLYHAYKSSYLNRVLSCDSAGIVLDYSRVIDIPNFRELAFLVIIDSSLRVDV